MFMYINDNIGTFTQRCHSLKYRNTQIGTKTDCLQTCLQITKKKKNYVWLRTILTIHVTLS